MTRKLVLLKSLVVALLAVPAMPAAIQVREANTGIQVAFEGNRAFTADQLRIAMELTGKLSRPRDRSTTAEELEQGLERVRQFLTAEGYLNPRIGKPQIEESGTGFIGRVPLEEGPLYRLGEVKVTGATVFSEEQIIQALDIKRGDPFRREAIQIWFRKLQEMYANRGYMNWTPIPRQELKVADLEPPEGTVDLTIDMEEGSRVFRIEQSAPPSELSPSPLEAFAARSTAKVVWSKMIGRLESQEARATITALIVEDTTSRPNVMRGLRIDLAHMVEPNCDLRYLAWRIMCERANAAVYVEEQRLEEVRNGIGLGAAQFISKYESRAGSVQLSKGLIVCGYQFSDREPSELAALFTRAIAELKEASR